MDNLARIIAVTVSPGQIQPCIRLNKGIYTASLVANAQFKIEVSVTYTSGGQNQGPIVSTQLISSTQFMQNIDAHTIRAKGQVIGIRTQPDANTPIVFSARVLINDATGTPIECWWADTSSYQAPPSTTTGGTAAPHAGPHG